MHASPPTTNFFWSTVPEEMDKIDRLEETNTNMEMEIHVIKCNVHTQTDYKHTYIHRQTINTHTHTDRL